jgi:hypothetical protein
VLKYQDHYSELELASLLGIGRKALWTRRRRWGLPRPGRPGREPDESPGRHAVSSGNGARARGTKGDS